MAKIVGHISVDTLKKRVQRKDDVQTDSRVAARCRQCKRDALDPTMPGERLNIPMSVVRQAG